ncbi:hypothetical protein [Ralstonia insidiosa]|uniref:hypothetical protein n=1 Tax=Ralstonia insidiosa TaxID=190721 RepID=UPI000CEDD934|nr:hypothetical protein [Ralstonia insidiosa]
MTTALDEYLATGLFGESIATEDGRYQFVQLPLLLAPSRGADANSAGAVWSDARRGWFANASSDLGALARWLPDVIATHYFLATASTTCWKCRESTPVFSIAVPPSHLMQYPLPDDGDGPITAIAWEAAEYGGFLSDLVEMSGSVRKVLAAHCPAYRVDYSHTADTNYLMNHCASCGAKQGDFYLHQEPGGAFFPITEDEAARITLRRVNALLLAQGSGGMSSEDLMPYCVMGEPIQVATRE